MLAADIMNTTPAMPPKSPGWVRAFKALYERAVAEYGRGSRERDAWFSDDERRFLAGIGCGAQELYDFAEDSAGIEWETALLITAVRRDYFHEVQRGVVSARRISAGDLPAKDAELGGIPWLPRIIEKAKARLRGEMPDDLMYCCGGDRNFFREHGIHPADFLRLVWLSDGDARTVLEYVRGAGAAS
jgi:hypothetical protein